MLGLGGLVIAWPGLGSVGINVDDSTLGLMGFLLACVSITVSELLVRRRGLAVG